jgi:hypothetical protein
METVKLKISAQFARRRLMEQVSAKLKRRTEFMNREMREINT